MPTSKTTSVNPTIKWENHTFFVSLPIENGQVLDAQWNPGITYIVRVREFGTKAWSLGFETPLTGCSFVDLKPDVEYEFMLTAKNVHGESEPVFKKMRTKKKGETNVIPIPER